MVLVQASRLPKGLRDRAGSHLDRWLLLILGLARIPHFITTVILKHSMISILDNDIRISKCSALFDLPACQRSTR
jgi:hypothetical protein